MAQHICNYQYLYQFYQELRFDQMGIECIDQGCLRFNNLTILSLIQNNIQKITHIPSQCKQLYLDFNQIDSIDTSNTNRIELLSLSHNSVNDTTLTSIANHCPELRCLNISYNQIQDLKGFVVALGRLDRLKILASYGNPISMLRIYYPFITEHLHLLFIDGEKYAKEEPPKKEPPKKQEPKKEEPKDDKKDKKDAKKGGKAVVEEKPEEPPKEEEPKEEPKKELTKQDFELVRVSVKVGNLQGFHGNVYDSSLFPADTDANLTQTTYWAKTALFEEQTDTKSNLISFENATTQDEEIRLNLDLQVKKELKVSEPNLNKFNKGLRIEVWQREPKMNKDPDTQQSKPEVVEGQVEMTESIVGAVHIDFRKMHKLPKKQIQAKFKLFPVSAAKHPLFADPYADHQKRIEAGKAEFEEQLKKLQEARAKEAAEEEQARQQKKGGKDQKKAAEKKGGKKDVKDVGAVQKKKSEKCGYPMDSRQYCVLEGNKIFKGKELLCVSVTIE